MVSRHRISVFFAGNDQATRSFALSLEQQLSEFFCVFLFDIDGMDTMTEEQEKAIKSVNSRWPLGSLRVPVYVLSVGMICNKDNVKKLVLIAKQFRRRGQRAFYICHGITFDELRMLAPELETITDDVRVGNQRDDSALIGELLALTRRPSDRPKWWVILMSPITFLGGLFEQVYLASFLTPAFLFAAHLKPGTPFRGSTALLAIAAYGLGSAITRLRPLDLWPHLGQLGKIQQSFAHTNHPKNAKAFWRAVAMWRKDIIVSRGERILIVGWLLIPIIPWTQTASPFVLSVLGCSALVGLFGPIPLYRARLWTKRIAYWVVGLTLTQLDREKQLHLRRPSLTRPRLRHVRLGRGWFRRRSIAFISYSHHDPPNASVAMGLAQALRQIGIPVFWDRWQITDTFGRWREPILTALFECTHFFLIVSPGLRPDTPVYLEAMTALQRWYLEPYPAVILVASEKALASTLEELDPEMRELLTRCPCLEPREATDAAVIEYITRQRSRHGLLQDWPTLLSPRSYIDSFLREFGREE